jgi:hypothetical protein
MSQKTSPAPTIVAAGCPMLQDHAAGDGDWQVLGFTIV